MRYAGFCGSSNPSQSLIADGERTVNWYKERLDSPYAPTDAALYPTPGRRPFLMTPDVGARAYFATSGHGYAVVGGGFYEVFGDNTYVKRGTVAQDGNPATMAYNGIAGGQLLITSGGNGYLYVIAAPYTFTTISELIGKATQGGMVDGRFLAFDITTGTVKGSAINDGATWNSLVFFQRSAQPDPWQSMTIVDREIWLIGESTGEVWVNVGTSPQPFALYAGSVFSYGIAAPFGICKARGALQWLAKSGEGAGCIVRAAGYSPQPVSNYAVETAIAGYARSSSIGDCEGMTYEQEGHLWGGFSFTAANATWYADLETGDFHERGTWNAANNRFDLWQPRVHMYAFNKHLVGDRNTGIMAELDVSFGTEANGDPIRRLRMGPPLWPSSSREQLIVNRFGVMVEPGLGLTSGQGSDPKMMLRTSYDAKTWSAERMSGVGRLGNYRTRVFWTRCGASDMVWVPEISVSDPIPWRLSGADIEGTGFSQAAQRAA